MTERVIMRILLHVLLLVCAATAARAQGNIDLTASKAQADIDVIAGKAFSDYCLIPDPRIEKVAALAAARELRLVAGGRPEAAPEQGLSWEVAASDAAKVELRVRADYRPDEHIFTCELFLAPHGDQGGRLETLYLDEIRRRPNAKLYASNNDADRRGFRHADGPAHLSFYRGPLGVPSQPMVVLALTTSQMPPAATLPPPEFATAERTHRIFTQYCMAEFPDIGRMAQRLATAKWRRLSRHEGDSIAKQNWILSDPFGEMQPYSIDLTRTERGSVCALAFDHRAAISKEQLARQYRLKEEPALHSAEGLQNYTVHTYSAEVGLGRMLFELMLSKDGASGAVIVTNESR